MRSTEPSIPWSSGHCAVIRVSSALTSAASGFTVNIRHGQGRKVMSGNMVKESGERFLIPAQALTCSEAWARLSLFSCL